MQGKRHELAPHVEAALRPAQPKALEVSGSRLAPHVQAAIGAAQARLATRDPGGRIQTSLLSPAPGRAFQPAAPVVQPSRAPPAKRRRVSAPLVLLPPPDPVLTAVHDAAQDQEGYCGNFQRVRDWNVANPVAGLIVQEVWRTFNVTNYATGLPLAGAALNAYVQNPASAVHATETHYWELWTVSAGGVVSDGGTDTFGLCSLIPWNGVGALRFMTDVLRTTWGSFVMRGRARFYRNPAARAPTTLGFARNGAAAAGGLFSRVIDPAATLTGLLGPAVGAAVNYTVTVTWASNNRRTVYSTVA